MRRILIIGGCGFIGKNLSRVFAADGKYSVIVFDKPEAIRGAQRIPAVRYISGDFGVQKSIEAVFRKNKIDIVFHLVSTTVPAISDGFGMVYDIESNLVPTVRLLCLMEKYHVGKIVFASSGGTVYGLIPQARMSSGIAETFPTNPICSHGTVKLAIEKYIQLSSYLHGIEYLILRISNPYGEHHSSRVQGLINVILRNVLEGKPVTIWGDGRVVRDYLYVGDCVRVIKKLIDKGVVNDVLNVGSGIGHSVNDVLRTIESKLGRFTVVKRAARRIDVPKVILNVGKLRGLTGYTPIDLSHGINRTLKWIQSTRGVA